MLIKRCNRFAKLSTLAVFLAILAGALVTSIPPAADYPRVAHLHVLLGWWLAGGVVFVPLVAVSLWCTCAAVMVATATGRRLVKRVRHDQSNRGN
jgi:hypothetical protein